MHKLICFFLFVNSDDGMATIQTYTFDFFNYAGIHRSVMLYTTPMVYIKDVYVTTDVNGTDGTFLINFSNLL